MPMKSKYIDFLHRAVRRTLNSNATIKLKIYQLNDRTIKKIELLSLQLSIMYQRNDLNNLMAVCIKECAENGLKANAKRIFFQTQGLDLNNENEYLAGMSQFKDYLRPEKILKYLPLVKKQGYRVDLELKHSPELIEVLITNTATPAISEQKRIRAKFKNSLSCANFTEFLAHEIDYTEGAGLGLSLVINILKKLKHHAGHLFLFFNKQSTTAYLVFPLKSFRSLHRLKQLKQNNKFIVGF